MNEFKPCPFCGVNDWQYHSHFSGATIRQCGECGTIVDESIISTRPIEEALKKRITGLESQVAELKPYRDGYDPNEFLPEEGENVIATKNGSVFIAQLRDNVWHDSFGYRSEIRGGVERWWMIPGYYPEGMQIIIVMHEKESEE